MLNKFVDRFISVVKLVAIDFMNELLEMGNRIEIPKCEVIYGTNFIA